MPVLKDKLTSRVFEYSPKDDHPFDYAMYRCRKRLGVNPEAVSRLRQFVSFTIKPEFYNEKFLRGLGGKLRMLLNRLVSRLRYHGKKVDYVWRIEAGAVHKRVHVHMLTSLYRPSFWKEAFWLASDPKLQGVVESIGFVNAKKITDSNMAAVYVSKYISKKGKKHSEEWESDKIYGFQFGVNTRMWACSRSFEYAFVPRVRIVSRITPLTPPTRLDCYVKVDRVISPDARYRPSDFQRFKHDPFLRVEPIRQFADKQYLRWLISYSDWWKIKLNLKFFDSLFQQKLYIPE